MIVTDKVPDAVQLLQAGLGVGVYDGQGSDMFTAVGDEHGLFIVVKQGRIWFPDTGKAAELSPVTVAARNHAGTFSKVTGPPYRVLSA